MNSWVIFKQISSTCLLLNVGSEISQSETFFTIKSVRINMFRDDSFDRAIYKTFQDNCVYVLSFQLTFHLSVFFFARVHNEMFRKRAH